MPSLAVRVLATLALAVLHCGAGAVPVNDAPADRPTFLVQEHWPAAQWVEPTPFVITGLSGLDHQPSLEEPMSAQFDPAERAARLLALWIRLAAAADGANQSGLLELELPVALADETSSRRPLAAPASSVRSADLRAVVPTAAVGSTVWDVGSVSLAVAPLPARASFDSYVSAANAGAQSNAVSMEAPPPLRSIQLMPWIGLALALLAIGWIGWRTAG